MTPEWALVISTMLLDVATGVLAFFTYRLAETTRQELVAASAERVALQEDRQREALRALKIEMELNAVTLQEASTASTEGRTSGLTVIVWAPLQHNALDTALPFLEQARLDRDLFTAIQEVNRQTARYNAMAYVQNSMAANLNGSDALARRNSLDTRLQGFASGLEPKLRATATQLGQHRLVLQA